MPRATSRKALSRFGQSVTALPFFGKDLELAKRLLGPVNRPKNDRDDAGFAGFGALKCSLDLHAVAVVGRDEFRTYQKENDNCSIQAVVDLPIPLLPGTDLAVVPLIDHTLPFQRSQVVRQLVTQLFIFVRIGIKKLDAGARAC